MEAITSARRISVPIRRRLRFVRSTQAPISKPKRIPGKVTTALAIARLMAEPVNEKTKRGNANMVKELPRLEQAWPAQNFQKSGVSRGSLNVTASDDPIDCSCTHWMEISMA